MERYVVIRTSPRESYEPGVGILGHYATKKEAIRDICGVSGSLPSTQLRECVRDLLTSGTTYQTTFGSQRWTILEVNDEPVEVDESPEFDQVYQEEEAKLPRPETEN